MKEHPFRDTLKFLVDFKSSVLKDILGFEVKEANIGIEDGFSQIISESNGRFEKEIVELNSLSFLSNLVFLVNYEFLIESHVNFQKNYREKMSLVAPSYYLIRNNSLAAILVEIVNDELLVLKNELQINAYAAARRTMRVLVEAATLVCEFQTDPSKSTLKGILESFLKEVPPDSFDEKKVYEFVSQYNLMILFLERLQYLESFSRYERFKEIINRLGERKLLSQFGSFSKDLRHLYSDLSRYGHASYQRILSLFDRGPVMRLRIGERLRFDPESFKEVLEQAFKTIDFVLYFAVTSASYYLNIDTSEFMNRLSSHLEIDREGSELFKRMKYSGQLLTNISWRHLD